jgi:hypothetical protein
MDMFENIAICYDSILLLELLSMEADVTTKEP